MRGSCALPSVLLMEVIGCRDLASQKVSFDNPRHEIYGGSNNSVFIFVPSAPFSYVQSQIYTLT